MLRKNNVYLYIYGFLLTILFILFGVGLYFNKGYQLNYYDYAITTPTQWLLDDGLTPSESVSLPIFLNYKNEDTYTLSYTFNEPFHNMLAPTVIFASNHMYVSAYLDGKEIYAYRYEDTPKISQSPGNQIHLIPLPLDCTGKTLEIKVQMALKHYIRYEIPPIGIGDRSILMGYLIRLALPSFILMMIILFLGFQIIILNSLLYNKLKQPSLFHLGFFALIFGLYGLCDNTFVTLISCNAYLIYLGNFLLFSLLPLPLLFYFKKSLGTHFSDYFNLLIAACILNFLVQIILHFSHVYDLREMVLITQIIALLAVILLIVSFICTPSSEYLHKKSLGIKIIPMSIGAVMDYACYLLPLSFVSDTLFFQFGAFIFLILEVFTLIQYIVTLYKENLMIQFYRDLAYTDSLTGLLNRSAFEQELEDIQKGVIPYNHIWCISIDLNNLKETNDTLGHQAGDLLIQTSAKLFLKAFANHGKIFRVGGDEFAILIYNLSKRSLLHHIDELYHLSSLHDPLVPVPISFALGYTSFSPCGCETLTCALDRADALMYANKEYIKSTLK